MPNKTRDPQESVGNTTSIDSGIYIPTGYGKGCPPKIFTHPNYVQNSINNDKSESDAELLASKPTSDWDEDLIDLTQADNTASKQDNNPLLTDWSDKKNTGDTAEAQPQATPRQPPPG